MKEPPSRQFMEEMGLTEDDYPPEVITLWPETEPALYLYSLMSTQWRGNGGGLDYAAVPVVLDLIGERDPDRRRTMFEDMRVIEGEVMKLGRARAAHAAQAAKR